MSRLKPAFQPFLLLAPLGGLFLLSALRMTGIHLGDGSAEESVQLLEDKDRIEARRGEIHDAEGRVLATDRPVWELYVEHGPDRVQLRRVPLAPGQEILPRKDWMAAQLDELDERLDWFSDATGLSRESLSEVEEGYAWDDSYYRAVEAGFTYAESRRLASALSSMKGTGLKLRKSWERVYPQGRTFAHLLGFTAFNRDALALKISDDEADDFVRVGMQGLERVYDDALRGVDGEKRSLAVVPDFGVNPALEFHEAEPGATLRTTLDARLGGFMRQQLSTVVEEWGPDWCVALAMDVKTGAILGVEALPDFDCNSPGESVGTVVIKGTELPAYSFPAHQIDPGSTVKPLVVAKALSDGAIRADQHFENFGGAIQLGRRRVSNAYMVPTSPMTPAQALIHSSNVVLVQIGLAMDPDGLCDLWEDFGYADTLELPVLGRKPSSLPPRERYHSRGAPRYTIPSVTFGVELGLSPLHHLSAWQGLLNDGLRMKPHLEAGREPEPLGQAIDPQVARQVRGWLEGVVDPTSHGERDGRKWLPRRDDLRWGGKSGSADPDKDKKAESAVFMAFGPIEDPEVVVMVLVMRTDHDGGTRHEERFSGSRAAGVSAGEIMMRALELRGAIEPLTTLDSVASGDTLRASENR